MENCAYLKEDFKSSCTLEKPAIRNGLGSSSCRWDTRFFPNQKNSPCYSCFVSLEDQEEERIETKGW